MAHGLEQDTLLDPNLIGQKRKPTKEKVLEIILASFCDAGYWKPTQELADHLDLLLKQLSLGKETKKRTVYVWCTVVVLSHCMTHLIDYHEYWQTAADAGRAWLFNQPDYASGENDLIKAACDLVGADADDMRNTIFAAEDTVVDTVEEEDVDDLGDWEELYLEEPPYTVYYRHRITYKTTWDDPRRFPPEETTQNEAEHVVASEAPEDTSSQIAADENAAKQVDVSQYRLPPERLRPPSKPVVNISCQGQLCAGKNEASIFCLGCEKAVSDVNASWNWKRRNSSTTDGAKGLYLCEICCDEIHMNPAFSNHVNEGHFRFSSCLGRLGFPS